MAKLSDNKDQIREEIYQKVKGLKLVYTDRPQPELLIKVPHTFPGQAKVTHKTMEFTSLCPFAKGQPDYAAITIIYLPDQYKVELKSLKFYLQSFRMTTIFHEDVPPTLLKAIWDLVDPLWMYIHGHFTIRGGILTEVEAEKVREGFVQK